MQTTFFMADSWQTTQFYAVLARSVWGIRNRIICRASGDIREHSERIETGSHFTRNEGVSGSNPLVGFTLYPPSDGRYPATQSHPRRIRPPGNPPMFAPRVSTVGAQRYAGGMNQKGTGDYSYRRLRAVVPALPILEVLRVAGWSA